MRRGTLLVVGLIALAASLIGSGVEATIRGDAGWRNHMSGDGHMGWWGDRQTTGSVIDGAIEEEVTATEFDFSPDELTVAVGEPFNLSVINEGDLPHDLVIPDLGVRVDVQPHSRVSAGLEVDEVGSYRFLCSYPGHAEAGMTGMLTVRPSR